MEAAEREAASGAAVPQWGAGEACGCGSAALAPQAAAFGVPLCRRCFADEPLVPKGAALERYLLSERDLAGLGFVERKVRPSAALLGAPSSAPPPRRPLLGAPSSAPPVGGPFCPPCLAGRSR